METAFNTVTTDTEATTPQLRQVDAVKKYVFDAVAAHGIVLAEGQTFLDVLSKDVKKAIRVRLFNGIKTGTIRYKPEGKTDGDLKKYCSSLLTTWLKKQA